MDSRDDQVLSLRWGRDGDAQSSWAARPLRTSAECQWSSRGVVALTMGTGRGCRDFVVGRKG